MNRNEFQKAAKLFRAGRLTLEEFSARALQGSGQAGKVSEPPPPEKMAAKADDSLRTLEQLFHRDKETHKGSFGHCLLVGGSRDMPGSIGMAGLAALRSGAGLVKVATTNVVRRTIIDLSPCLMTLTLDETESGEIHDGGTISQAELDWADTLSVGPGLGTGDRAQAFVADLLHRNGGPTIVDADGLNALAPWSPEYQNAKGLLILTPHPGEFQRLFPDSPVDRIGMCNHATEMAKQFGMMIVLKGHQTLVTDGQSEFINQTGNPGMATGGSGDVLTGMISGLIAQKLSLFQAACLAVEVHGMAGDLASQENGELSMIATDLLDFLPAAFQKYKSLLT